MCTVTWIYEHDGYELFCNRDEKLTRKPATVPGFAVRDGVRILAPADGDFGGAWIGTNEFGLSLCLLNAVSRPDTVAERSRGLLLIDLLPSQSVARVHTDLERVALSAYAPFTLVALERERPTMVVDWDGHRRTIAAHEGSVGMLTSSSFDTAEVKRRRLEQFEALHLINPAQLRDFHGNHCNGPSAYTVCMHRPDAQTVSFSHIQVTKQESGFYYSPAAPCESMPGVRQALALRTN